MPVSGKSFAAGLLVAMLIVKRVVPPVGTVVGLKDFVTSNTLTPFETLEMSTESVASASATIPPLPVMLAAGMVLTLVGGAVLTPVTRTLISQEFIPPVLLAVNVPPE